MISVIRVPPNMGVPAHEFNPIMQLLAIVGRAAPEIVAAIHGPVATNDLDGRPYATVVRNGTGMDVVSFAPGLTSAILSGHHGAEVVQTLVPSWLVSRPVFGPVIRLAFTRPTVWKYHGWESNIPTPASIFGSLAQRWQVLARNQPTVWPALPFLGEIAWHRLAALVISPGWLTEPTHLPDAKGGWNVTAGRGIVEVQIMKLPREQWPTVWALARFGEYRGTGRHTSYGLGRYRILRPTEGWSERTDPASVWDAEYHRVRRGA